MKNCNDMLSVKAESFENGEYMPIKHTGFGEDLSPALILNNLSKNAVSIAIVMDDLDIPMVNAFNHWLIWNIPASEYIPEGIEAGESPSIPVGAKQGIGYGVNRYRGPKQPAFIRTVHKYVFNFYILDCMISISGSAKKKELLEAMDGHIIQTANIIGKYKR